MKKVMIIFTILLAIPFIGFSQTVENLDYISPFKEGLAAIKKDSQWAFINKEGAIAIEFRNDVVTTESEDGRYPIFKDNRCLVVEEKDGVSYFGYMDNTGKIVIKPQFLNASNFDDNQAIALELKKEEVAKNTALGKAVVYYRYYEVTIDPAGNIKDYLNPKGVSVVLDKKYLQIPPEITSIFIAKNLMALKAENGTWMLKKIN